MMKGGENCVSRWVSLALLSLMLASHVDDTHARATGAPVANTPAICSTMTPGHQLPATVTASPYTMTVDVNTFSASQQVTVTITTGPSSPGFKGIFLQIRRVDNDQIVGSWSVHNSDTNFQAVSCDGSSNNAVTHRNNNVKGATNTFMWTAPATKTSDVKVVATFVQSYGTFWVKIQGPTIQNNNPCNSNPCLNGGTCEPSAEGYLCNCPSLFTGPTCHLIVPPSDPCASNPCLAGGTCISAGDSFTCNCPPLASGRTCHFVLFPCDSNPCQHGGSCVDTNQETAFVCGCTSGFTGIMCEASDPCGNNPCFNGGTCQASGINFVCICPTLFAGQLCEIIVSPCDSNPCVNGGACLNVNQNTGFLCICADPGTTSLTCADEIPCSSNPCANGGTCQNANQETEFECSCLPGFTGVMCQITVACHSNPCTNGGTCIGINQETDYTCVCKLGYAGLICETAVSPCEENSCENGATCNGVPGNGSYTCTCPADYIGTLCQTSLIAATASTPGTTAAGTTLACSLFMIATTICGFIITI